MRYDSGGAFRRALEDRLRSKSLSDGTPLIRLRKMVAFERFLARLIHDQPHAWLLKGGVALQWRLGGRARTTQDLDLPLLGQQAGLPVRFSVQALLDGRPFETFHLDVGWGDPVVEPPEELVAPSLLQFAGVEPLSMLCYPVTQHIAEKLHAYTRPRASRENSRVKDLVDIVLMAEMRSLSAEALLAALRATFQARGTHSLPTVLPDPPSGWTTPYHRMAAEVVLDATRIDAGLEVARRLLDPVLQGRVQGRWDPEQQHWFD